MFSGRSDIGFKAVIPTFCLTHSLGSPLHCPRFHRVIHTGSVLKVPINIYNTGRCPMCRHWSRIELYAAAALHSFKERVVICSISGEELAAILRLKVMAS